MEKLKLKNKLSFTKVKNNAKLQYMGSSAYTLSFPAGKSCPFADKCLSTVKIVNGKRKIQDGKNTEWRCFSASQEALYKNVYENRNHNFDLLRGKTQDEMYNIFKSSMPEKLKILRLHVSGDIFSENYLKVLIRIAKEHQNILFYGYTKSLNFWVKNINDIPENLILTASRGGKWDNLIDKYKLKYAEVVFSEEEAKEKKLKIDHDDSLAYLGKESFALLIHGNQPKESLAGKAVQALREKGIKGYSSMKKKINKELVESIIGV